MIDRTGLPYSKDEDKVMLAEMKRGMTAPEIHAKYGKAWGRNKGSISQRCWLLRNAQKQPPKRRSKPAPATLNDPLAIVKWALNGRFEEKRGGYFLDGRPCSLDTLFREGNTCLKRWGLAQVGRKPEWLV
jgi:hypothetical protein